MIVLASRSPRRAELLRNARFDFIVRPADIDETWLPHESANDYALRLAKEKSRAIEPGEGDIVLGADTVVVLGSEIMGKPTDAGDARRILQALSGRKHDVITAIALRSRLREVADSECTSVWFAPIGDGEIDAYIATGEPMDKAGAYGIQGVASRYVDKIEGSYTNVVGLPVALLYQHLRNFG